MSQDDASSLVLRLRKRADTLMPTWAERSSAYWYVDGGGRRDRDDANLMREAAEAIRSSTPENSDSPAP